MPGIKHTRNYLFSGSLMPDARRQTPDARRQTPDAIITVDGGATIR